jgi:hypothetical protein
MGFCIHDYHLSSGVLDNANLPDLFNLPSMTNVRWKIMISGLGLSSPVIWGDKLFITTAVSKADNQGIKPGIYGDGLPVQDSYTFKQVAEIPLNDICLTAPSITDGMIFFRTQKYLIAVGKK